MATTELNALIKQKDNIEAEIMMINEELMSPGLNGEPRIGISDSLVDSEGFPRSDIDIYQARYKRQRLNILQNDHVELMKRIESSLKEYHRILRESKGTISGEGEDTKKANSNEKQKEIDAKSKSAMTPLMDETRIHVIPPSASRLPFALVDQVSFNSPASRAGLLVNDKLLAFGSVRYENNDNLSSLVDVVRNNIGREIQVVALRGSEVVNLSLIPNPWEGQGMLGCHIVPYLSMLLPFEEVKS